MGWLWSSDSSGSAGKQDDNADTPTDPTQSRMALSEEQRLRIFGRANPNTPPQHQAQSSRDQQADAELEDLIRQFSAAETASTNAQTSTAPSALTPAPKPKPSRVLPDGTLDISPSAMYPRTMSCRQQFDQAFYCQSLGGKFNSLYRYGSIRSCSEQWGAFWFCMRTRTLPEAEKEDRIKEFYQEREEKRKAAGGSSEDVWEIRTRAVERAFWRDPNEDADLPVKD